MEDNYSNFSELLRKEDKKHYRLLTIDRKSDIVIIAPHGGGIEPGTSEVARQIAGKNYSLLMFEGILERDNKKILHITSSNINYPKWIDLIKETQTSVSIHGTCEKTLGPKGVEVGGLNKELIAQIRRNLSDGGFFVKGSPAKRNASSHKNIVNYATENGCQMELGKDLRNSFFSGSTKTREEREQIYLDGKCSFQFYKFTNIIRDSLKNYGVKNEIFT